MVASMSMLRTAARLTWGSICPGAFTNSGTGAISSTLSSLIRRRLFTPTRNE